MMDFEYRESREDLDISCGDNRGLPFFENEITSNIHAIIEKAFCQYSSQNNNFRNFQNPSLEKYRKQVQENERRLLHVFGPRTYDPAVEYCLSDEEGIGEKKKRKKKVTSVNSSRSGGREKSLVRTPLGLKNQKNFINFGENDQGNDLHKLARIRKPNYPKKGSLPKRSLSSYHTFKRNKVVRRRKKDLLVSNSRRPNSTHDLLTGRRNSLGNLRITSKKENKRRTSSPGGLKLKSIVRGSNLARNFGRTSRKNRKKTPTSTAPTDKYESHGLQKITFPETSRIVKTRKGFVRKSRNAWGRNSINGLDIKKRNSITSFDKGYVSNLRKEITKKNLRRKKAIWELKREKTSLQRKLNDFKKNNQRNRSTRGVGAAGSQRRSRLKKKVLIPGEIKSDYNKYLEIKKKIRDLEGFGKLVTSSRKRKDRK